MNQKDILNNNHEYDFTVHPPPIQQRDRNVPQDSQAIKEKHTKSEQCRLFSSSLNTQVRNFQKI